MNPPMAVLDSKKNSNEHGGEEKTSGTVGFKSDSTATNLAWLLNCEGGQRGAQKSQIRTFCFERTASMSGFATFASIRLSST